MRVSIAAAMTIEPRAAISCLRRPTALVGLDDRSELEQTSSARLPVTCAAVVETGLISYRSQAIPALASAIAARLALGQTMEKAVAAAQDYTWRSLERATRTGQ